MTLTIGEIERMGRFVLALKEHYGAIDMPMHPAGHRTFSNPWAMTAGSGEYIWIMRGSNKVRFGSSITRALNMSDRMIDAIADRKIRLAKIPEAPIIDPGASGSRVIL